MPSGRSPSGRLHTVIPMQSAVADPVTVEHIVMLNVFEQELDSLLEGIETSGKGASELMLRRYTTADDIYTQMQDAMRRIELKMAIVSEKMVAYMVSKPGA